MKNIKQSVFLYPITLEPHEEGGYFASCPTLQGCHASGDTMGEAIDHIYAVIHQHVQAREEFGDSVSSVQIPAARSLRLSFPLPVTI